jgi:hypothetical protein
MEPLWNLGSGAAGLGPLCGAAAAARGGFQKGHRASRRQGPWMNGSQPRPKRRASWPPSTKAKPPRRKQAAIRDHHSFRARVAWRPPRCARPHPDVLASGVKHPAGPGRGRSGNRVPWADAAPAGSCARPGRQRCRQLTRAGLDVRGRPLSRTPSAKAGLILPTKPGQSTLLPNLND